MQHNADGMVTEIWHGNELPSVKGIALAPGVFNDEVRTASGIFGKANDMHEVIVCILL